MNDSVIMFLRAFKKFCSCGREAVALCDWKVPARQSGTCDRGCCAMHVKEVVPGKFLCPEHQLTYDDWKRKHPPSQGDLFAAAA